MDKQLKINKDLPDEEKYDLTTFMEVIRDNEEFYNSLKEKIVNKLNIPQ